MTRPDLRIDLIVIGCNDKMTVIRIVRKYSSKPASHLLKALNSGAPIFDILLKSSDYYEGWKDLFDLVVSLKSCGSVQLIVNGTLRGADFVDEIKAAVEGIRKEDVY